MAEEEEVDPRPYVDHTYHDFSRYIDLGGRVPKHKKSDNNFPAKLHMMLSDQDNSHIITWMPHGRAWKILDKDLLMSTLAPAYFGQTKFQSFTRQLNGWGFKRLHRPGSDFGGYYHQCFLRGLPKLTPLMRRVTSNQGTKRPHAAGEPNFVLISRTYPLPPANISSGRDSSAVPLSSAAPSERSLTAQSGNVQNRTLNSNQAMHASGQSDAKKYPMMPLAQGTSLACSALAASVPSTTPHVPSNGTSKNLSRASVLDSLNGLSASTTENQAMARSGRSDAKYPIMPLAQDTLLARSATASVSSAISHVTPNDTGQNPSMPPALDSLNSFSASTGEAGGTTYTNHTPFYSMKSTSIQNLTDERAKQESTNGLSASASRVSTQMNHSPTYPIMPMIANIQNTRVASSQSLAHSMSSMTPMTVSTFMNNQHLPFPSPLFSRQNELTSSSDLSNYALTSTSAVPQNTLHHPGSEHCAAREHQPQTNTHPQENAVPGPRTQEQGGRLPNVSSSNVGKDENYHDDINAFIKNFPF